MNAWTRLVIASLLLVVTCQGQSFTKETPIAESSVPKTVLQTFKSAYPTAKIRGCRRVEIDGTTFYKIETREGASHRYFSYSPSGELKKTEDVIAADDLPAGAQQSIHEKYADAPITFAAKITQGDQIAYRVNVKSHDKMFKLELDAEGKITAAREVKLTLVY